MRGQLHRGAVLLWRSAPCRDAALSRAVRSRGYAAASICRCTINTGWVLHRGDAWPLRKRCTICLEECPFRRGEACLALLSHGPISPQGDACVPAPKNIHRIARDTVGWRRSLLPQRAQGQGVILAIQYRSTASSAANSTATVTDGGRHVNCSRNSRSGPISLSREKTTWKDPAEFAAQRDASTDTTAVHFRSSVDGCISANAKVGLHACWPAACVTQIRGLAAARSAGMRDRFMGGLLQLICNSHPGGGAEACFTLNIAADVSAAYAQNPPAIATKNPIAPRSSQ